MGTSMSSPTIAQSNRLNHKTKGLTSYTKNTPITKNKIRKNRQNQSQRSLSQDKDSRKPENSNDLKKMKSRMEQQDFQDYNGRGFGSSVVSNYMELAQVGKEVSNDISLTQSQNQKRKKQEKSKNRKHQLPQGQMIPRSIRNNHINNAKQKQLKLSLNSNNNANPQQFYGTFSEAIFSNEMELKNNDYSEFSYRSKSKIDNLLKKMIKEEKKSPLNLQTCRSKQNSPLKKRQGLSLVSSKVRSELQISTQKNRNVQELAKSNNENKKRFENYQSHKESRQEQMKKSLQTIQIRSQMQKIEITDHYGILTNKKDNMSNSIQIKRSSQLQQLHKRLKKQKLQKESQIGNQFVISPYNNSNRWGNEKKLIYF